MQINRPGGFILGPRSFGAPYDPCCSTQRRIGKHVYIFRRFASGIDVWRLELDGGHRWTLVHSFNAAQMQSEAGR